MLFPFVFVLALIMEEKCKFLALMVFLFQAASNRAALTFGGVGVAGSGGNFSIPNPTNSSTPSKLSNAYTALQAWKTAINSDPKGITGTWVGWNVCAYNGVFCSDDPDDESGRTVSAIDLNRANLQGRMVGEISLLADLSLLHLNSNRFTGTVPDTLKYLFALTELDLSNNQFSGPFPLSTLAIPNLVYLDLRFNSFSGPVPDNLFNKNLDAIFLNNNRFEGAIPQNLGNSPASVINLANNNFTGNIPFSMGFMDSKLREILLLNNKLTGCIPQGIGLWSDLEVFDVSSNSLVGHLPDSVSCLGQIEVLNFGHNELSGELPDLVCSLKKLLNLTVAYNFFSGFGRECADLSVRNVGFDYELNCIPGTGMQRPQPECSVIPGYGLSCVRIPSPKPLVCGGIP